MPVLSDNTIIRRVQRQRAYECDYEGLQLER